MSQRARSAVHARLLGLSGAGRGFAVALLVALLLLCVRQLAEAHTVLVSAEPAANSHVAASPPRVRLVFSEPLEPSLARVSLVAGDARVTMLESTGDPHDVHAIVAPLTALASGVYRVQWRVVSADGHPVEGSYVFTVDGSTGATPPVGAPPDVRANDDVNELVAATFAGAPMLSSLLRGLAVGSLMTLCGLLTFMVWPRGVADRIPNAGMRVVQVLSVAAPVLLALHAVVWTYVASPDHLISFQSLSAATSSSTGTMEVRRIAFALLALWAATLARRPVLALVFAMCALLLSGTAGHPSAINPLLSIPAKAIHLVAGATWLGGVLWLLVIYPVTHEQSREVLFQRESMRVSSVAFGALWLVAVTGAVQALLFMATPLDLVRTAYGALTLAKVAGTLVLVAFGAYYRRRVLPRLGDDAITRTFVATLRREVAVFAVLILLGGLLAYVPPRPAAVGVAAVSLSHMDR